MKLYVLSENTAKNENFAAEHGLSIYIEAQGKKILFDTGAGELFLKNAIKLGVDLASVDFVVLSHGHSDHGGGLAYFMQVNKHAVIYAQKDAFLKHYNDVNKDISVDEKLLQSGRIEFVEGELKVSDNISISEFSALQPKYPITTYGLQMEKNGLRQPDDFLHEQYLTIEENNRRIVFSGCSHRGILNIISWLEPNVVVGGFHFFKLDLDNSSKDRAYLKAASAIMTTKNISYYTCHCTGQQQYAFLKQFMQQLEYIAAGSVVEL